MIGYYNYTVVLTYLGMLSGFFGIICIGNGNLPTSLICLMVSGLCDMFDGKIASTRQRTQQEKKFGIQIDSLSDLICFGVLPAMIAYHCTGEKPYQMVISAAYLLSALIRLAWYNVDEEERQTKESGARNTYLGLPVTTAALIFPMAVGIANAREISVAGIMPWLTICVAAGFLTPFKLKKPERIGRIIMVALGIAILTVVMIGAAT